MIATDDNLAHLHLHIQERHRRADFSDKVFERLLNKLQNLVN